jgi:energy-coupling factor transport system permease protein
LTTSNLRLGYLPRQSFIHRLNPLTKLAILICVAILTVTLISVLASLIILAFLLLAYVSARVNPLHMSRRLRYILTFALIIAIVQLLFTAQGTILFYLVPSFSPFFGPYFPITTIGVANAIILALRLINIVLASGLFVAPTDPTLFAVALTRIHFPYRYSFLLVLTLRLVPLFDQELSIVHNAQRVRGIRLEHGVIRGFLKRLRYTFIPLIVSALSRVDTLTLAMDGRGFGYAKTRTYLRQSAFTHLDLVVTVTGLLLTCFLLWQFIFLGSFPKFLI